MLPHDAEEDAAADDGRLFAGVRFALVGFDPVSESQYRSEMVRRGGADAGGYGADCTHLVICGLLYDDPVCVAARKDGKKVVSELWVDDSLDLGEVADADRVLYRPVRDFNGIPGSESPCICLTGYQKNGREDIMKMVTLMGAQFSKPLIAHKVTHLVCYKFEGEKYELAKRVKINLVNHQWLEDCLMAWKILPVDDYTKSGWELEIMMSQVKDSEDEEEAGRSSSASKCVTRSTHATEIIMTTLVDPGIQAPTQGPTISSGNEGIAAGGQLSTPEQIKKAGGSSKRSLNIKSDRRNAPKTTGLTISSDPDAHESADHSLILNGKEKVPKDQINRDEATDDVKKALGVSPGGCSTPNIGGSTVYADHHVHQLTTMPAMLVDNTENIDGNCLDSANQNNANNVLWSAPSKENFSEKTLQLSDTSGKVLKDGGSAPDLHKAVHQSNAERKLTLCEANLRLTGNAASKNTQISCYSRKRSQKSMSLEANLKSATASPQSFERITTRVEFNISPSRQSHHKITDLTDAESLRDDEVVKKMNKSGGVLAQRTNMFSSISPKPSNGSSATGTTNSPFSSKESASEAANISGLSRNSTQPVILTEKEKSVSFKSNLLSYRRTSLKLVRPVEEQKLPESSTDGRKLLRENPLALYEARSEKDFAASSSSNSEVEKRICGFSLQNGNTEMSDVPQVNKTEAVAPNTDSKNVVSHQNLEAIPKEIQVTVITDECGTFPQEAPTSKVKNASAKRFLNTSNKAANRSLKSKYEFVSSKSNHDKVVSHENIGAQPEKNHASPNGAECTVSFPEEISNSKADNVDAKSSQDANSEMNCELAQSNTELTEENMDKNSKKLLGRVIADGHQISSFEKAPNAIARNTVAKASQIADVDMPDASTVNNTGSMSSKSGFKEVCRPENAESCPQRLSSDTKMDDIETCTPNVVPKNRVRKAVRKRKVSSVPQNSFGADPCKNGRAFVSEAKVVYSRRASGSSKNASKATVDQTSNEDGAKDAGGSFFKDAVQNRMEIFQNLEARSSKRQKAADLMEGSTDHNKENLPVNSNVVSKSKYGNNCVSSKYFAKEVGNGKDVLADHGMVEENDYRGTLSVLEPRFFILSGHRLLRKEYKSILRRLKGRICRDSHSWSLQATHFITPELRRTEKFFAATASGSWILKPDYLTACNEAGKFLEEEPFEWHGHGLSNGDTISMDAPRKWRQLRQHTGHGAFYGMQIIIYGECISPSLDTLKRAVRAGDGTILATCPPYARFLRSRVDFAVVSAGMPDADAWVQEFKRHGIPCISADYLVEYVCKPCQSLSKHVLFNTHDLADKSHAKLLKGQHDVLGAGEATEGGDADPTCSACGSNDREGLMLICGSEQNGAGCGVGMHMHCCNPPLEAAPDGEWLCANCHQHKPLKKAAKSRALRRR
ncbi:hypothetical protein ABZP36_000508 [Zizania latifolia]